MTVYLSCAAIFGYSGAKVAPFMQVSSMISAAMADAMDETDVSMAEIGEFLGCRF